jgi:hypothetical protein
MSAASPSLERIKLAQRHAMFFAPPSDPPRPAQEPPRGRGEARVQRVAMGSVVALGALLVLLPPVGLWRLWRTPLGAGAGEERRAKLVLSLLAAMATLTHLALGSTFLGG